MSLGGKGATAETLAGTRTMTVAELKQYKYWQFDPGGAGRTVALPTAASTGACEIIIRNTADAAEVLTVTADSATVVTPTQAETAVLYCDGVAWFGIAGANS
jgi:hypothetical protein